MDNNIFKRVKGVVEDVIGVNCGDQKHGVVCNVLRANERTQMPTVYFNNAAYTKAKFHYASWFGAGSELVRSWFELKFGLSSSLLKQRTSTS